MDEHRHTVIIKNEFQHRIILQTVLMTFITLNVIIILIYLFSDFFYSISNSKTVFSITLVLLELVGIVAVYFISRKISFRIAGPIYAMERSLKTMSDGDLTIHLTLRNGDYFYEVSDAVNKTIDNFHQHIEKTKEKAEQTIQKLDEGSEEHRLVTELITELSYFKTEHSSQTDKT